MGIVIEVDSDLHAAYIRLSELPVARTVEYDDDLLIDLDEFGVVVGIEVLNDDVQLPFEDLVERFHVRAGVVELLRQIRPDVKSFVLGFTHGQEGTSIAREADALHSP